MMIGSARTRLALRWPTAFLVIILLSLLWTAAAPAQEKKKSIGGITSLLIKQVESATGFRFAASKVEGSLLSAITLRRVTVSDRKGIFVRIGLIRLDWSPSGLFSGNVKINELRLDDVAILRKPLQAPAQAKPFDLGVLNTNFPLPTDLQFEKLAINKIQIAAGVLSKGALAFGINGRFILPADRKSASISLVLNRLAGAGPQGSIKARLVEDTGILTIDTRISEAPNGVVGQMLGLRSKDALTVSLKGAGPLDNWNGAFLADTGAVGRIDMAVKLREKGTRIILDGSATSDMLSEQYAKLGKKLTFKIDFARPNDKQITLNTLTLKSNLVDVTAQGKLFPNENRLALKFSGSFSDLSLLEEMTGLPIGGKGDVNVAINGTPTEPVLDLSVSATDARFERYRARRMTITAKIEPRAVAGTQDPNKPGQELTTRIANLKIVAEGAQVDGPESAARLLEAATIEVRGLFDTETGSGRVDLFKAVVDGAQLTASGQLKQVSPLAFTGKFAFKGSLKPDLLRGARVDDADVSGNISVDLKKQSGTAQIKGTIAKIVTTRPKIDAILKGMTTLNLDGGWLDRTVTLRSFTVKNDVFAATGQGTLSQTQAGSLTFKLAAPSLTPFSGLAGVPLTGSLQANADLKSTGKAISGTVNLDTKSVSVNRLRLGDVTLSVDGKRLSSKPDAAVKLRLSGGRFDGTASADIEQQQDSAIQLRNLKVDAAGIRARGQGRFDPATGQATGALRATIRELRRITQPFGIAARGFVRLNARLRAAGPDTQAATVRLTGRRLRYTSGGTRAAVGGIQANVSVADVNRMAGISGRISARSVATGGTRINRIALVMGKPRKGISPFRLTTLLRGGGKRITAAIRGSARLSTERSTVWLRGLSARYGALPVRLIRGGTIRVAGNTVIVTPLGFNVGGGRIRIAVQQRGQRLRGQGKITGMPARTLRTAGFGPPLRGTLNGSFRISGNTARPVIRFDARASKIRRFRAPLRAAIDARATGTVAGSAVRSKILLTSADPKDRLEIDLRLIGRAIRASIDGEFGLARLSDSGLVWQHRATGRLKTDLKIDGAAAAPRATGEISVVNGRFVNAQTGAILDKINLRLVGSGSRIRIAQGNATDGGRGKLSLAGWIDVSSGRGYPMDIRITTERAKLLRLEEAQMTVTSRLQIDGAVLRRIKASGRITINSADLIIPEKLPNSITVLDVIEINGRGKKRRRTRRKATAASAPVPVTLDLDIQAPSRFFVRGRGLEAEFNGALRVRGQAAKPVVTGGLRVRRGRLDLLGQRFGFRRGWVRFNNPNIANPSLLLVAVATNDDVTGIITISGTVRRPKFNVSSEPSLPRDEVLARIMFGKKADELSQTEALRLAAGAVTLFGPGGAGVMDKIRRATGLDVIDVTSGPDGPRAVAGKYISDKVLLKIEQGYTKDSTAVGVEVEVRKNVKVETKFNSEGDSRIGIRWRKDY